MKTICFFSGNINRTGGTERVTTIIANALVRKGYDVKILSMTHGRDPSFDLDNKISLFSLDMQGKSSTFSNLEIFKKLHLFLEALAIDYIVDVDIILSLYSIPASFALDTDVISWEHFNYFVNVGDVAQRTKRKLARLLAARYSKTIVTLTNRDRINYLNAHHCKAGVIAINNPMENNNSGTSSLRSKNVIAVGRLTAQKGFDLLLEAWRSVHWKNAEWVLTIVGSGEDEARLKHLAALSSYGKSVEFIENTQEISQHYMNSSIYVMSSRYEGFPMVLLEAKSFGLPIVSFDCDTGPREIIRDHVDGLLVEKENPAMLAAALLELINDDSKRLTFGACARKDDRFALSTIIPSWEQIFV